MSCCQAAGSHTDIRRFRIVSCLPSFGKQRFNRCVVTRLGQVIQECNPLPTFTFGNLVTSLIKEDLPDPVGPRSKIVISLGALTPANDDSGLPPWEELGLLTPAEVVGLGPIDGPADDLGRAPEDDLGLEPAADLDLVGAVDMALEDCSSTCFGGKKNTK